MEATRTVEPPRAPARAETVELSIVIPCLNEALTLETCIRKAQRSLAELGIDGEVVVADNGSTDGSRAIAEELGARVVPVVARGYGNALAGGIAEARGRWVIMGDADDSYDFARLGAFVEGLRGGSDLVVGNRFTGGIEPGAMPWLHEHLGNPVLSFVSRRLFGAPVGDVYCGLRGFDRRKIEALDLRAAGMEFAIEMVVKATIGGLAIAEVPITLSPDGRDRRPHLNTWRDGWRSLRLLLLYSPRWLFLFPGLALMTAGLAASLWLIPAQRSVGGVTFDVTTLLYAALAVVVGYQAVLFFVSARLFGVAEGLLPESPALRRLGRALRMETGLLLGAVLATGGLVGSIAALESWNRHSFGRLDYPHTLRIVIPSSTLIVIGMQTILSSLFLGILRLKRR